MLRRDLQSAIARSLDHFPVVLLIGARQVGKSTLAQAVVGPEWPAHYLTLDDRTILDAALFDPDGFVRQAGERAVIDEVQRAPDLLRAVKLEVDRDRRPGRFLLTGSANVLTLASVSESLAGRVAVHRLRPFSWSELRQTGPAPLLDALFEATDARDLVDRLRSRREASGPEELQQLILSGGYPTPALMPSEARSTWFASFRQTYIERDLRDLTQIANLPEFSRLMTTLTLRTAQLLNASELSRQVGLPTTTLRRYVHLLEQTFQFDFLQPFAANLAKRLVKMPKVYASDTGMACHLAAAADWTALERRNLVGPIVETWAHAEIRKALALQTLRTEISFWRTRTAQEVDFFLERGGEIVGIEVKWSSKLDRRDLRALNRCRETLGDAWRLGVVLHGGVDAVALDGQTAALPFSLAFA